MRNHHPHENPSGSSLGRIYYLGDVKDGAWLKSPSGFFRTDGSVKPSYSALKDLVKKELWYHAKNHHVNNQGRLEFYGPLGDYKLSLQRRDYKLNVNRSGQEKISLKLR